MRGREGGEITYHVEAKKRDDREVPGVRNGDGRCGPDAPEGEADPRALLKKLALWAGLALCVAFIAWVAWGFFQFDHDIDHPREGGFSGWQCDAGRDCGS
ncbi:hypothetical protein ABR737_17975 [Streptomyces sp. Edi2]|uniref:hypothetical protein n=1 Tax=Streptomyces sp. Edi2 TaxID=3162528 RepID=UPI003305B880